MSLHTILTMGIRYLSPEYYLLILFKNIGFSTYIIYIFTIFAFINKRTMKKVITYGTYDLLHQGHSKTYWHVTKPIFAKRAVTATIIK